MKNTIKSNNILSVINGIGNRELAIWKQELGIWKSGFSSFQKSDFGKNFSTKFYFVGFLLSILLISSCQQIINVDLQTVSPKLVIEAIVTDQPGPYLVNLSRTINYNDINVFPQASGATVILSDDKGTVDTLREKISGQYFTNTIKGSIGTTYTLKVLYAGQIYTSKTTMQAPIQIDSMSYSLRPKNKNFRDTAIGRYNIHCFFRDRLGIKDYTLLKIWVNHIEQQSNFLYDGKYTEGEAIDFNRFHHRFELNDTVSVQMYTIDETVYNYFATLNSILKTGGLDGIVSTGTPDNPNTNISNGALGYFAAYSVQADSIIIVQK